MNNPEIINQIGHVLILGIFTCAAVAIAIMHKNELKSIYKFFKNLNK